MIIIHNYLTLLPAFILAFSGLYVSRHGQWSLTVFHEKWLVSVEHKTHILDLNYFEGSTMCLARSGRLDACGTRRKRMSTKLVEDYRRSQSDDANHNLTQQLFLNRA